MHRYPKWALTYKCGVKNLDLISNFDCEIPEVETNFKICSYLG